MPTFAEIAGSEYVLLTTFTRDGRPKPTAVWAAPVDDKLLVITQEKSWKVKRIRNTPRVTIAKCDRRGEAHSEPAEAVATVLDKDRTAEVYDAIAARYGVIGKTFNFFSKLKGGMNNNVGLELKAA